eukprot:TRINITY_DN80314_c0_g1_i1.p1 TRINITY_DN80314_c0_g1~~TRINITY_DN80314_c0_g1_i1.p1  ORF type:complete len:285 (+),score=34.61 TRINITY_DN80314_c0_g1_i1:105-959(+)
MMMSAVGLELPSGVRTFPRPSRSPRSSSLSSAGSVSYHAPRRLSEARWSVAWLVGACLGPFTAGRSHRGHRSGYRRSKFSARRNAPLGWSDYNCGRGVEISADGRIAKRVGYNTTPEGWCGVISQTPLAKSTGSDGQPVHYGEVKIETDSDVWNYALDIGVTALTPAKFGKVNPQSLSWAELGQTWIINSNGLLRVNGRSYPPGAIPGRKAEGFSSMNLVWRDRLGILVSQTSLSMFINGVAVSSVEVGDIGHIPVDQDLYLVADVVGRACEIELLDSPCPDHS